MTLHFYLRFSSTYGQRFYVTGNLPELGNGNLKDAVAMYYLNDEYWHLTIDVPEKTGTFAYKYVLRNQDGSEMAEWSADRVVNPAAIKSAEVQLKDIWNYPGEYDNTFFTQPFMDTLLKPAGHKYKKADQSGYTHVFKIKAPLLLPDEVVCLLGSGSHLGNWNDSEPLLMSREGNWFSLALNLSTAQFPVEYKYGVYNLAEKRFVKYENGANRLLYGVGKRQVNILHDGFIQLPNNSFKGAGIAIPVFSLRSRSSYGIGEFTDIKALADWAAHIKLKLIQLLPVNDTTATHSWTDSYPYAPISVFALHPVYLNLAQMAGEKHADLIATWLQQQSDLNSLSEIDYEAVLKAKWGAIKTLYPAMKAEWLESSDYQTYYEANKHWLVPYAAFCYLRDKYKTADFASWKTHASYWPTLKANRLTTWVSTCLYNTTFTCS